LKSYYNALIASLSTAKPSVFWTMVFLSHLPMILMGFYVWEIWANGVRSMGAAILFSELVHAGAYTPRAREAMDFAFAPSHAYIVMMSALGVSVLLGWSFGAVAMRARSVRISAECKSTITDQ
jgi:hypothetical protein